MASGNIRFETLLALALGELNASQQAEVEQALAENPALRRTLDQIRAILHVFATDDSVEPPETVVQRLKALYRAPQQAEAPGWLAAARELLARLVFDSRIAPAVAGFRGGDDAFQLSYESEAGEVDLECEPTLDAQRHAWRIMGQVTPRGPQPVRRVLVVPQGSAQPVAEVPVDADGVFTVQADPGAYTLYIEIDGQVITLPGIEFP